MNRLTIVINTNEQETIWGTVTDSVTCVVSIAPKYQHVVSSLGSEEWENYIKWQTVKTLDLSVEYMFQLEAYI